MTLLADPRSNSILVRADNPGRIARVRQLIEQLDTPGTRRRQHVHHLPQERRGGARRADASRDADRRGQRTLPQTARPRVGFDGIGHVDDGIGATPPTANHAARGTTAPTAAPRRWRQLSAGGAMIQADTANNALIIAAPEPVYNNLRAIIEKLDVRRAQVFVEALIVEVSADKAAEFGIQWQALSGYNSTQTRVIGGTNFTPRGGGSNIIDVAVNPGSVGQGLALGLMKGAVTIPGLGTITNLAFLARALETQANANILSTPTLLTLDNEEARIIVGQNVPFVTGQYATTGNTSTVTPFQTIERKDVGLMLRVKPQITEGGSVRLAIYQEVSRDRRASTQSAGIITNEAFARIVGDRRRRADRRAGRPDPGSADRRQRQGAVVWRHSRRRRALSVRCAPPDQDQPDDLHQDDRAA